jgi:hypothetical protein
MIRPSVCTRCMIVAGLACCLLDCHPADRSPLAAHRRLSVCSCEPHIETDGPVPNGPSPIARAEVLYATNTSTGSTSQVVFARISAPT